MKKGSLENYSVLLRNITFLIVKIFFNFTISKVLENKFQNSMASY